MEQDSATSKFYGDQNYNEPMAICQTGNGIWEEYPIDLTPYRIAANIVVTQREREAYKTTYLGWSKRRLKSITRDCTLRMARRKNSTQLSKSIQMGGPTTISAIQRERQMASHWANECISVFFFLIPPFLFCSFPVSFVIFFLFLFLWYTRPIMLNWCLVPFRYLPHRRAFLVETPPPKIDYYLIGFPHVLQYKASVSNTPSISLRRLIRRQAIILYI